MNGTINRPAKFRTETGNTKSEPQIKFANDLLNELANYDAARAKVVWRRLKNNWADNSCTYEIVSGVITKLLDELKAHRAARPAAKRDLPDVPPGRYAVENSEGVLAFYRVKISKTGFVTVAVKASEQEHELPFKTAVAVLRKVEAYGPEAASIRYGQELGHCGVCGIELTDPESRSRGIGPVCIKRFG